MIHQLQEDNIFEDYWVFLAHFEYARSKYKDWTDRDNCVWSLFLLARAR